MKTAYRFFFAIAFTLAIIINGCQNNEDPSGPSSDKNFTFAKVGNKWIYKMMYEQSPTPDITMEVIESKPNNVYKVLNTYPGTSWGTAVTYWYVKGDEMAYNCDSTGVHKNFYFNSGVQLNQVYMSIVHYSPFFNQGDTVYTKITSFDTPVTVPAGTFQCIKIVVWGTQSTDMPETEVYISRTAGQIKQQSAQITLELKSKNF